MTKQEIFQYAHKEAREMVAKKRISYAEAFKFGLRRAYNKVMHDRMQAGHQMDKPKFMFLRGM